MRLNLLDALQPLLCCHEIAEAQLYLSFERLEQLDVLRAGQGARTALALHLQPRQRVSWVGEK
jgi:hypothetical protein